MQKKNKMTPVGFGQLFRCTRIVIINCWYDKRRIGKERSVGGGRGLCTSLGTHCCRKTNSIIPCMDNGAANYAVSTTRNYEISEIALRWIEIVNEISRMLEMRPRNLLLETNKIILLLGLRIAGCWRSQLKNSSYSLKYVWKIPG